MTRDDMKKEAISRMKNIGIEQLVIDHFEKYDHVFAAKNFLLSKLLPEEEAIVADWEKENGGLVYHVVCASSEIGELLSFLYVSKYEDDWASEREIYRQGDDVVGLYGYAYNLEEPMFSDFGFMQFKNEDGILIRVG